MDRGEVSHSLVVNLRVDDGALGNWFSSSPRSALELEGLSTVLVVANQVMCAREIEPSRERQGHWRPADQHGVSSDGKCEQEGGQ